MKWLRSSTFNDFYPDSGTWDKSFEDAFLLEDLGDVSLSGLSELWLQREKGGWNARLFTTSVQNIILMIL